MAKMGPEEFGSTCRSCLFTCLSGFLCFSDANEVIENKIGDDDGVAHQASRLQVSVGMSGLRFEILMAKLLRIVYGFTASDRLS